VRIKEQSNSIAWKLPIISGSQQPVASSQFRSFTAASQAF
jgi:hypothetical protein